MSVLHPGEAEFVRVRRAARGQLRSRRPSLDMVLVAFLGAHVPLGLIMDSSASIARMHGLATVAITIGGALLFRRIAPIVYSLVYLVMCGVLWRMTEAGLPWEIAKHALWLVSFIVLARFHRRLPAPLALFYMALLLPGAAITVMEVGAADGRAQIVFNLAGPLALAAGTALFTLVRLSPRDFRRITYIAVAPVTSIWIIALTALLKVEEFTTESSKEAVGGFGPNQVSTILGLGALLAILWAFRDDSTVHRMILGAAGLTLLAQSVLTFSRGGLYNTIAALLAVGVLYVRRPSRIFAALALLAIVIAIGAVLFDRVDGFTDGNLGRRFADTNVTGRDELARDDLSIWAQEPVTGVGAGQSRFARTGLREGSAAHTEFTRLRAEPGLRGARRGVAARHVAGDQAGVVGAVAVA
ncbi:MAG: O-antigen ligase family protein, partial [Actinomycetota bacterium]